MESKNKKISKRKNKWNKKTLWLVCGGVAALLLVVGLGVYFVLSSTVNKVEKDTICDNIYVDSIELSGMKADEAKSVLEQKLAEYQATTVKLVAEEVSIDVALSELGFQMENVDSLVEDAVSYGKTGSLFSRYSQMKELEETKKEFHIVYGVDSEIIAGTIEAKIPELENSAKDATIVRQDGKFIVTDDEKGVEVDPAESAKIIEKYMNESWKPGLSAEEAQIELATMVSEPKVTRAQLEQIQDVLGTFTTHCGSGGGRVKNIVTGTKFINGSVVMPGEIFSADAPMRPYTFENGYAEAGSYENGKVVQSLGGGICQISSTLYNACLLAELEITQRMEHSMLVGYVKPAMDAAIAGDYKDLKFKNNTDSPIYLEGYVSGGYITFTIYGKETRPGNREIKYISETLSSTPATKKFVASDAAIGSKKTEDSGHTGMKAQLWKVIYENGKEVSREIVNKSNYRMSEATISVGTKSSSAEATAVVKNAIATQDEAKINAAIAQAQAIIAQEQAEAQKPAEPAEPAAPTS